MRQLSALYPGPVLRAPPLWITIATGVDELLIPRVRDVLRLDRKRRDIDHICRMFVVPPKRDRAARDAQSGASRREADPLRERCRALRDRCIGRGTTLLIVRKAMPHVE